MENNFGLVLHDSQCTNNCVFCKGKKMGDIKKNIIFELDKIGQATKDGRVINRIEISGQDPGEYSGLPEFVKTVKRLTAAQDITLITNGKKLANIKFLKKIVASGVNNFIIPLYGPTAKIHDKITGSAGSFVKTRKAIDNIYKLKQKISFQGLITRENQNYLDEFVVFLAQLPYNEFCRLGIPCYKKNLNKFIRSIPDFEKLKNQLSSALRLCQRMNFNLQLFDIPRCLVNFYYENMGVNSLPVRAYENLKKDKTHAFKIIGEQVIPEYRLKKKGKQCGRCVYFKSCGGFFSDYIDLGYFKYMPVKAKQN